jgi:hypothetical protein
MLHIWQKREPCTTETTTENQEGPIMDLENGWTGILLRVMMYFGLFFGGLLFVKYVSGTL